MAKEEGYSINYNLISQICNCGLDECPPEDRCAAWLVLSTLYPTCPEQWPEYRVKMLNSYKGFIKYFKLENYENVMEAISKGKSSFPLGDEQLMTLIYTDLARTYHHLVFFPYPDETVSSDNHLLPYHNHIRRLERILYIFAKMNSTFSYLQGFNELVSVIFYVLLSSHEYFGNDWTEIEAFSFYIMQALFCETRIGDLFTMDDDLELLNDKMEDFMMILKIHAPRASEIITKLNINPLFFGCKWLNLLFAQDYSMPSLLLIWDALFSHFKDIVQFGYYIATASISMVSDRLKPNNYTETLNVLQKLYINDIHQLLKLANKFWNEDHPN